MAVDMKLSDGSRVCRRGWRAGWGVRQLFPSRHRRESWASPLGRLYYEPKDFTAWDPGGCNNCGGIISEGLVLMLAFEAINLSPTVVQRRSYVLHTDLGSVRIAGAANEKRIASVHRGAGPQRLGFDYRQPGSFITSQTTTQFKAKGP